MRYHTLNPNISRVMNAERAVTLQQQRLAARNYTLVLADGRVLVGGVARFGKEDLRAYINGLSDTDYATETLTWISTDGTSQIVAICQIRELK